MNKEVQEKIEKLSSDIKDCEVYKNYLYYKNLAEHDYFIRNLKNRLEFLKKCDMNDEEYNEYISLKKELKEHPILVNFENSKQELEDLLIGIKEILK